jgi:Fic family protein
VISVATLATETTRRIVELIERDRRQINDLGRAAGSALLVFDQAVRDVILRIPETAQRLPVSEPTVATAVGNLEQLGILREITGRPRNKIFTYSKYLEILSEGTEPL